MSYYQRHVFFCCNQREAPEKCCNEFGATELQAYAKARVKELAKQGLINRSAQHVDIVTDFRGKLL